MCSFAGAEVICAETVMNPVQLYSSEHIPEMEDELKFLFTVRSVGLLRNFYSKRTRQLLVDYRTSKKLRTPVTFWHNFTTLSHKACVLVSVC